MSRSAPADLILLAIRIATFAGLTGLPGCSSSVGAPEMPAKRAAAALPAVMRSVLLWKQGDLLDATTAGKLEVNFVHTFPRPPAMRGLIPVAAQADWLRRWSDQVAQLHARGIFVSASLGSTAFDPEIFARSGLKPDDYYARDAQGRPSSMLGGAYGKELMTSCYVNPHWIERVTENVVAFADAGFDGMWFDVGGYADRAVLYCQCQYCKAAWREHRAQTGQDPATALPTGANGSDYTRPINREFLRWRWDEWIKWENAVQGPVRRGHPKFAFAHNMGVGEGSDRGFPVFLHSTTALYDYVHWEEFGHGTAPYSDLPSYLLGVAAGRGKQVMLVQNDKPRRNPIQNRIFLAEAYASGGVPEIGVAHAENSVAFMRFVRQHEDLYRGTDSLANVAVVYSWWSQAICSFPEKKSSAQWMGRLLLDLHIPFDYLIAERDLAPDTLARYKTLVVPEVACLSETQVAAIRGFLRGGGNVIATRGAGRFDEELGDRRGGLAAALTGQAAVGSEQREVGRGRLVYFADAPEQDYWQSASRDFAKAERLTPPAPPPVDVVDAFNWAFGDTLPVRIQARPSTALIARRQGRRIALHFVNYDVYPGGQAVNPDRDIGIAVTLPPGGAIAKIAVLSPDLDRPQPIYDWKLENRALYVNLPELQTYSIVTIELAP